MAATDQNYRSQKTLDIVFGVTCVLMLLSIVWMFAQDYFREYKVEIRNFRDVEEALNERDVIKKLPNSEAVDKAEQAVAEARKQRDKLRAELDSESVEIDGKTLTKKELELAKVKDEAKAQGTKADYDSLVSLYNIAVDQRDEAEGTKSYQSLSAKADSMYDAMSRKGQELDAQNLRVEKVNEALDRIKAKQRDADHAVEVAEKKLKDLTADFDRLAKVAVQKRWKVSDRVRTLPVIDAFASPTRIEQIVLDELPIDYNFKRVTRYDRCTTCHQGIDRANFSKQALRELTTDVPESDQTKLASAKDILNNRRKTLGDAAVDFDISDLRVKAISDKELSPARISQFCAHPRLDLFVDEKSPHPKEKFGCTICHTGQGSATDFNLASHTPNDFEKQESWHKEHSWESNHFWDFPMLPKRFLESTCIKCHHQVTDLLPNGDQFALQDGKLAEVPGSKVVRGYNIVKDLGCFGCHEISSIKNNREVGPDLRLEPNPPLAWRTPAERAKLTADPLNMPGTERKVAPSLKRIREKTNQAWVRRWLEGPRKFRPDTKMPHFYNLSNNSKDVLPEGQKEFPDAEIHAIAYFLFDESKDYLKGKGITPIQKKIVGEDNREVTLPAWLTDEKARGEHAKLGAVLFTERGCLACHQHRSTAEATGVTSAAHFGPNLSDIVAKIAPEGGDEMSRYRWLVQWILNPNIHFPRAHMPITHLDVEQAAEVAAWLLSQKSQIWSVEDPPKPDDSALEGLAHVWLEKGLGSKIEADSIIKAKGLSADQAKSLKERNKDADELRLVKTRDESWSDKLKWYVGRKAISQMGCYACHDIPGFDQAKPIGTPLNDWGKKDPDRLAFEDVVAYAKEHYNIVDVRDDEKDPSKPAEGWHAKSDNGKVKLPYEKFFFEALEHHHREGFLHQKLMEPRSYDNNRLRAWDERLRMPQFKFSRKVVAEDASPEEKAQAEKDEADAREAVMTFILSLVAEPVPPSYVYNPPPDKLAIAKGKHVLEKFNCAGCHYLQPGTFDVKLNDDLTELLDGKALQKHMDKYAADHVALFQGQSEWTGKSPAHPGEITVTGMPMVDSEGQIQVRLTEAARYMSADNQPLDVPAGETVSLPKEADAMLLRMEPEGGDLVQLLATTYLPKKNKLYADESNARASLPPPLFREGEKVQPAWLFDFLKNPHEIRPMTVLRMPKFNMSDDDANALVQYFAAVDNLRNPGGAVSSPFGGVAQRSESFWQEKTAEYIERLHKENAYDGRKNQLQAVADWLIKERAAHLDIKIPKAEAAVKEAKGDDAKLKAQQALDALKKEADQLKNSAHAKQVQDDLARQWETDGAYGADAFRVLVNYNNDCMACHSIGGLRAKQPRETQGPVLDLAWQRLRPEWTARWILNPDRMISYKTPMPRNFPRNGSTYPEMTGTSEEKGLAVRDLLMNLPQESAKPENRFHRPVPIGDTK